VAEHTHTRYWFDTEFMEDGKTIELISIGMVCDDGREFYAESLDAEYDHANEWVRDNVLPHLWHRQSDKSKANIWSRDGGKGGLLTDARIATGLIDFVADGARRPEFWAYYGDYDWVVLCQLYGRMIDLPNGWPMFAMDVKQYAVMLGNPDLPAQTATEHHALEDARWTRDAWAFLRTYEPIRCPACSEPVHKSDAHYVPSVSHLASPENAIEPYWNCTKESAREVARRRSGLGV